MQRELLATHEMTFATCHVTLFTCRMGETWVTSLGPLAR